MSEIHGASLNGEVMFENKDDTLIAPSNIPAGVTTTGGIRVEGNFLVISLVIDAPAGKDWYNWFSIFDDLSSITGGRTVVPTQIQGESYADAVNTGSAGEMLVNYGYGTFEYKNKIAIYPGHNSSSECWTTYNGTALLI